MTNMARLQAVALALPETHEVNVVEWGDHPTFRVRNKTFVFSDAEATAISVKLPKEESAALVATRDEVEPTGHGLGRHGWVGVTLRPDLTADEWAEVVEWIEASYRLIAPKTLVRQLDAG